MYVYFLTDCVALSFTAAGEVCQGTFEFPSRLSKLLTMTDCGNISRLTVIKSLGPRLVPFFKTFALFYVIFPKHESSIGYCIFKCAPILCLVGFVLMYGMRLPQKRSYAQKVLLGLIFSCIGDAFLVWSPVYLKHGMFFFALAHLLYVSAFGCHPPALSLLWIVLAVIVSVWMCCFSGLSGIYHVVGPVYGLILGLMIWRAAAQVFKGGHPIPWTSISRALGATLFGVSDALLSMDMFFARGSPLSVLILPTYYAAQLCITVYVQCHGLRMPKAQRIALLNLTLSMACCPNLDPVICFRAINLSKLLMVRMKTLTTKSIQLDWRRFHDMFQWLTVTVEVRLDLVRWPRREVENLVSVIRMAKRFFPISCIEEIWLDFRHHILERMLNGVGQHTFDFLRLLMPLSPKSFDHISRTWLPDIIDLWYIITDFSKPFHDVVGVLAQVARFCRGRVDWEPHLERVFCGLLRAITLPHGPVSMDDTGGLQIKPSMIDPYAELLANAIGPDRPNSRSTVIERLTDFYKTVEPFYHPSNPRVSSALLISFTHHFVCSLNSRLRDELLPPVEQAEDMGLPPVEFNLTVEQVDDIVRLILPVVLDHMLFFKFERTLIKVARTIDILARLRPALVLPALLSALEEGVNRPESPLRYTRPLYALCFCVAGLCHVRFPLFLQGGGARSFRAVDSSGAGSADSDEDLDEQPENGAGAHDHTPDEGPDFVENALDPALVEDSVDSTIGQKIASHLGLLSANGQAHLKAFTFPKGRVELVRLMNLLLLGFDLDYTDRVYLTIACLSRLYGSIVYRGRVEPRILALLYILSGCFAAVNPSRFVQTEFAQTYLTPLLSILSELLYLSCGVFAANGDQSGCRSNPVGKSNNLEETGACPALAEAASSLLAVIMYRLVNYTIDLSDVDLMQSGSRHAVPNNLFLTTSWWTPFISIRSLFEQSVLCPPYSDEFSPASIEVEGDRVARFWIVPSDEARALADQLIHQYLVPILSRLEQIGVELSKTATGFNSKLTLPDQRNQFSSLLIWTNHLLMSVAGVLDPRDPDPGDKDLKPPPWHGHSHLELGGKKNYSTVVPQPALKLGLFSPKVINSKGEKVGLRDRIFDVGLHLLTIAADLFVRADDSLLGPDSINVNGLSAPIEDNPADNGECMFDHLVVLTMSPLFLSVCVCLDVNKLVGNAASIGRFYKLAHRLLLVFCIAVLTTER
ncbi:unnamed protein product [Echinostoma caproni]|uniref:lysoplasmalogenase n=1 Tax=Echinostoma caproni TaxID=27848 RepID=A0A183AE61_9TREM|nr:unnamed protein product [Echinostoma caproni]